MVIHHLRSYSNFIPILAIAMPGFLEINPAALRQKFEIARGGAGVIYMCEIVDPGLRQRLFPINVCVAKGSMNPYALDMDLFRQEVSIMYHCMKKRNIAKLIGYTSTPPMIVMQFYPLGSLSEWIHRGIREFPFSIYTVYNLAHGTASGLIALHFSGIAHCDVKPKNILLESVPTARGLALRALLSDFGVSRILHERMQVQKFRRVNLNAMSAYYAAPEVMEIFSGMGMYPQSPKAIIAGDVYAYGVLLYEMLTRKSPWK